MSLGPTARIILISKTVRPRRFGRPLPAEFFAPLDGSCLRFSWVSAALLRGSPIVTKEWTWLGPKLHRLPNGSLPQAPTGLRLFRLQVLQKPRAAQSGFSSCRPAAYRMILILKTVRAVGPNDMQAAGRPERGIQIG